MNRLVLLACVLASSLVGMDSMMTTVALPAIADGLHVGLSAQQWIVAAFLLAVGSLLLVGGALGDVYGRRPVFGLGVLGFGAAALVCAAAPSAPVLIAGRLAQGAAAALLLPSVLAVITATFEGTERSRAIASWSAWSGLSVIAGPVVGGVLISAVSWRAIYLIQVPCAVLVFLLIRRATPTRSAAEPAEVGGSEGAGSRMGPVDVVGALLAVPTVGGPAFFLIQGPQLGWGHPLVAAGLVAGVFTGLAFVWWERRARNPVLPLGLFRVRAFTVINIVTFVLYGALIASGTYTVLFLQDNLGYPPAVAGVAGAVPIVALFVLSGRFGALADRFGGRRFIAGGSIVAGVGMLLLLRAGAGADLVTVILPAVLVHGLGLAMVVAPLTSGVMSSVDDARAGAASGVNNAVARIGSMVAIAVVGALISLQFSAAVDRALDEMPSAARLASVAERAADRPLSDTPADDLTVEQRDALRPILEQASVQAYRSGMLLAGGLAIVAGVIAFVGLRRQPTSRYAAATTS